MAVFCCIDTLVRVLIACGCRQLELRYGRYCKNDSASFLARAARDFAIAYTKTRTRLPSQYPESYMPGQQFLAAEMDIALQAAWAFQTSIAARLIAQPRDYQVLVDAVAMQKYCMHTAVDVVNKAIDMVGGAALARRLPLERYYRDVRSAPMHPIGGYDALEMIGRHAFGLARDGAPRWA